MSGHHKLRKGQTIYVVIMAAAFIVIGILALIFVVRIITPNLDSSNEAQAKMVANTIAMSVDGLSGSDAGYVDKDFSLKEPIQIEIYDKSPPSKAMYVKVTYDSAGKYFEMPILASVEPTAKFTANRLWIVKELGGKVSVMGNVIPGYFTEKSGVKCVQPTDADIRAFIASASKETGLDPNLIKAVITQESSIRQCKLDGSYTTSNKNAVGLMQLTEIALAELRRKGNDINPFDAEQNVRGGSLYLSDQMKRFGDAQLALAAYNAGPTAIQKLISQYGNSWAAIQSSAPSETQKFVPAVYGYYSNCYKAMTASCQLKECRLC